MVRITTLILFGVLICGCHSAVLNNNTPSTTDDKSNADNDPCEGISNDCEQVQIYRSMKSLLEKDRVDLIGGLSIVRNAGSSNPRAAKSLEIKDTFSMSDDFEKRQTALETFAVENAAQFLQGRSLVWDPSVMVDTVTSTVRNMAGSLPAGVQKFVTQMMTEGRGRKKKLQQILPFLIGMKLKLGAALVIAAIGIALLAKKALLVSFISLAISIFIGVKKLLAHKHHHHPHHPIHHEHHSGWAAPAWGGAYHGNAASFGGTSGGWDAATSYSVGGDDAFGSHSSPVAHKIAFSGQKPKRR